MHLMRNQCHYADTHSTETRSRNESPTQQHKATRVRLDENETATTGLFMSLQTSQYRTWYSTTTHLHGIKIFWNLSRLSSQEVHDNTQKKVGPFTLSWARRFQLRFSYPIPWRSILILSCDEVALEGIFFEYFGFPCELSFHRLRHIS
jgi:hypothetical protein